MTEKCLILCFFISIEIQRWDRGPAVIIEIVILYEKIKKYKKLYNLYMRKRNEN